MNNMPKQLMESKLITDAEWEEYQRLKNNWNELKEHIKDVLDMYKETDDQYVKSQREFGIRDGYKSIELKMRELEKGDSDE